MTVTESADRAGGPLRIKVPLPFSLKWVNSYLIEDLRGYTLVDPGLHTEEAVAVWGKTLTELGIAMKAIHTILLTHQHPDHYGLAGWFQQRTGAPVLISRQSYAYTQRLWGENSRFADELTDLYAGHGMPDRLLGEIGPHLESFVAKVTPQPEVTFIAAGDTLRIGEADWQAIDAPGHALGQLIFYEPIGRRMLCGDQVLPDITPNISIVPGEEGDPLAQFIDSLNELRGYRVAMAYPGHRDSFAGFAERIDELIGHHERRLARIGELLRESPRTGYELCGLLFGARIGGNTHHLRFAMSETLAHLLHMERRGLAGSALRGGIILYSA